ncbi:hypothetical protein FB562_1941 [Homoserinimonas aerilata]|uniref:LPXTG-motif cell wall-anchored protein n=1 Tax=Homoserinimonas aerilata TaxID=1162970 RepID=A0A542YL62_9MICO|nr:hypothetical protein [Homoserinimonas aerilata]TQL48835.1 hypothetical protein FB562_1941 [Homoserinimonas aerilata]
MKPEFMRLRRALALTFATLLAAAGLAVLSPAGAASAHHNTVRVTVDCVDDAWIATWTVTNSERDKSEKIIASSQPDLVAVGTTIGKGQTFTATERLTAPTSKTLAVTGYWAKSNVTDRSRSASISPADFPGNCQPPVTPPVTPPAPPAPPVTPPPPAVLAASIAIEPCVFASGVASGGIVMTLDGLTAGTEYVFTLWSAGVAVQTQSHTSTGAELEAAFRGLAPGGYEVSATTAAAPGVEIARTGTATIADCTPAAPVPPVTPPAPGLPTLAPPTITAAAGECDVTTPGKGAITVTTAELDATKDYFVTLVDASGNTIAGVSEQAVSGTTGTTLTFAGLETQKPYTAQLLVEPGRQLAATADVAITLACPALAASSLSLPTLAMTGPSEFLALGVFAAALLLAGGATVLGRLRRRATQ